MAEGRTYANAAWPEMVSIDVTSACNLCCAHCYNDSGDGHRGDMDDDTLLRAGRQIAELRPMNLCLCGGEPLCRGEALFALIDIVRPAVGKVSMVSNGWALTGDVARRLKKSGVDAVQISLDGAKAWQHDTLRGALGSFDRAIAAIKHLQDAGISQISTAFLPNKLNWFSLEEYMNLCAGLGMTLIRTMPYLPSGRGRTVGRALMLEDGEYFSFCREISRLNLYYGEKIKIEWDDPLSLLFLMKRRAERGDRNIDMEIRATGHLAASTYLPIVVGDLRAHTLKEYWENGYDRLFCDERLQSVFRPVKNVYDLEKFDPLPYAGEPIALNIWGESL